MEWAFYSAWQELILVRGASRRRSTYGIRVYDLKPFYRGAKITVIGAISLKEVLAVMTISLNTPKKTEWFLLSIVGDRS
jgi:hypothetical protein